MVVFAAEKHREVLWHLPPGLVVLWYVLVALSVLVFLYPIARWVAKYRHGNRVGLPALRELPGRWWRATVLVYRHAWIRRRDPYVGWAHRAIFYGWVVLAIGTVIVALDSDFVHLIFGVHFWTGDFYLVFKAFMNVFGTFFIAAVLMMMVRRRFIRPAKLDYARPDRAPGDVQYDRRVYRVGDWVFMILLLVILLTGFVLQGVRIAMDDPGYGAYQFGGWVVAQALSGVGDDGLGVIRHSLWWFHGVLAIAFVASIPYTKAGHMLSSYVSLILRDPDAKRRLRAIPPERASLPAGYGTLGDFSIVHLQQLDACTKCGKCHEACPATATGRPLSPRDVILELREESNAAAQAGIGGVLGGLLHPPTNGGYADHSVIGHDQVRPETAWACMQCNACVEICPVGIEQAPIINQLRRRLVEDGDLDANLQSTLQTIHKSGNSFGENKRKRGRWTKELDFEVKDARKEPVDVLWFVGDYASFDPRSQRVTQAIARLLHRAQVDFGILYDAERNAGNDVRRVGEEGLYEALAEENIATLAGCDFQRIMTSDPHSLNTLRNEYPALADESWPVLHHTTLLLDLIHTGQLAVHQRLSYKVTYHDPCHLGRMNGEYDNPREIIQLLGCELREMPRNRDNSFCCGAGGGRIWIPDQPGTERPSENRIHEAIGLGDDLDFFVVTCPKDVTMYEDAIKTSGNAERLELRELTELIEEAVIPAGESVTVGGPS